MHEHKLTGCNDCEDEGCNYCDGRGYYEFCRVCGEPMGSLRKKWKRAGRPMPWTTSDILRNQPPVPPRPQCKDLPVLELLFSLWAWHQETDRINAEHRNQTGLRYVSLEIARLYPPDAVKVMMHVYGVPEKVVYTKLEKMYTKGLIECGGTIRLAWPTEKGLALLREAGLVDSA